MSIINFEHVINRWYVDLAVKVYILIRNFTLLLDKRTVKPDKRN